MALTKEYLFQQIIIGVANSNSTEPVGDTIAKMVHGVEVVTDSVTGQQTVSIADPLETDWDLDSWVTHGVLDFLSNYELAKIMQALAVDRNGRTARVTAALQMPDPVTPANPLLPDAQLIALSTLLDAEKTRRGI